MGLPFFDSAIGQKRDQIMAVDLGSRTTKAVHVLRRGQGFALGGYTLLDAPIYEKSLPPDLLGEHLKAINQLLRSRTRYVCLTVGANDAHVRHADLPRLAVKDLRQVLKLNSKSYLQQDLPGHVFDCHISAPVGQGKPNNKSPATSSVIKQKVLVAAARKQLVEDFAQAAKAAGLVADSVIPALVAPVNTFEKARPDLVEKGTVALVDLGFKSSSICLLQGGELVLSRVVAIGGDRMTSDLAENLGISYAEAEGIKIGMPQEVQTQLETLLLPLGRELRASIDFFEHQQDQAVTQAFFTGGPAQSEFIMQTLQREMMVDCQLLKPTTFLQMELPLQQTVEIEQVAPQLTVALGAALSVL